FIMQVVVVNVRGVCSPGEGLTTLGVVVCAKAAPPPAVVATAVARMIPKALTITIIPSLSVRHGQAQWTARQLSKEGGPPVATPPKPVFRPQRSTVRRKQLPQHHHQVSGRFAL